MTLGHHDLSHHGKDPGKLEQLKVVEVETMKTLRDLLAKLKQTKEEGAPCSTGRWSSWAATWATAAATPSRTCRSSSPAAASGTGQHLHFDPQNPPPLCNLYVSMLQRLGIEADKFSTGTGTLTGLEW